MNLADILNFINPIIFFQSPAGMIDLLLLVGIPAILLNNFWRALIFFVGFLLSQITFALDPWLEMLFEIAGIIVMILACTYKSRGVKDDCITDSRLDEGFKRSKKQPSL